MPDKRSLRFQIRKLAALALIRFGALLSFLPAILFATAALTLFLRPRGLAGGIVLLVLIVGVVNGSLFLFRHAARLIYQDAKLHFECAPTLEILRAFYRIRIPTGVYLRPIPTRAIAIAGVAAPLPAQDGWFVDVARVTRGQPALRYSWFPDGDEGKVRWLAERRDIHFRVGQFWNMKVAGSFEGPLNVLIDQIERVSMSNDRRELEQTALDVAVTGDTRNWRVDASREVTTTSKRSGRESRVLEEICLFQAPDGEGKILSASALCRIPTGESAPDSWTEALRLLRSVRESVDIETSAQLVATA